MVMPRSRSSGALSIESNARNDTLGLFFDSTFVIAAVSVVLPWSMCPIVPTFTCGLLRSNFSFAISPRSLLGLRDRSLIQRRRAINLSYRMTNPKFSKPPARFAQWSGGRDLNPRPSAWKAETLPLSYPRSYLQPLARAASQNRPQKFPAHSTLQELFPFPSFQSGIAALDINYLKG